ncbi:MAG: molybdenum cofactor guanylyltransferase [Dehalococcoidia bacterium]|nr:molybdenum cofactor guanylyltransferase [Dehalococcoidia bacterium]
MNDTDGVTGIVLAGGRSRRLGRDKAVETIAGQALIARVLDSLSHVTQELVVVVNDHERARELPLPDSVVTAVDIYPDTGSLGGIFTGLTASSNRWGIVVACDMPFLNLELLEHLLAFREGHDLVVPVIDHRPEPTHAAYSKVCLPAIETRLRANDLKIAKFFDDVRAKYVSQRRVEEIDPGGLSFFNINTEEDLTRARMLAGEGAAI